MHCIRQKYSVVSLVAALLAVGLWTAVLDAAPVVISATENWNGITIPGSHAADGVTLLGGVYTIPDGIIFNAGGLMTLNGATTDIGFNFSSGGGGIQFNTTANTIDVYEGFRDAINRSVTFNLGNNSITTIAGGGKIFHSSPGNDPRTVNINSTLDGDINLTSIILTRADSATPSVNVAAGGAVDIGTINLTDTSAGGSNGGNVTIRGQEVTLGAISTFTNRAGLGAGTDNGNVLIEALGYPTFDENVPTLNRLENTLTLNGVIATDGTNAANQIGGDITVRGVVLTLGPGFSVTKEADGVLGLFAGVIQDGFSASQLFIDNAPGSFTAVHNVEWTFSVPEPSGLVLVGLGGVGLLIRTRRRRASA